MNENTREVTNENMEEEVVTEEVVPEPTYVDYETFRSMDMRMGTIRFVEPVEGADKLLRFLIDFGPAVATMEYTDDATGTTYPVRQIVSGIREYYPDNYTELVGKTLLYIINLEPRMIRGVESQGMLMAVGEGAPVFVVPETEVESGSAIR
ncbi:hypothetical protein H6776_02635 [Candidatus Nomurabacteria bacterium]|nr:hypothetical protein [Candidatus Nomurabacteria bacterium]